MQVHQQQLAEVIITSIEETITLSDDEIIIRSHDHLYVLLFYEEDIIL